MQSLSHYAVNGAPWHSQYFFVPITPTTGTDVLVLPVGVARQFVCTSPPESGYTIAWGVNGTSATSSQFEDYIDLGEEIHLENGETQRKLTFTADARANNTHIRCVVNHIFNGASLVPVNIILTLQGKLAIELIK